MEPPEKWSQNICQLTPDIIKHWHPGLSLSKIDFWGPFDGVPGGWHRQTMSKDLFVKCLPISKQTGTQVELFKKIDFWVVHLGGSPGRPPNHVKIFFC